MVAAFLNDGMPTMMSALPSPEMASRISLGRAALAAGGIVPTLTHDVRVRPARLGIDHRDHRHYLEAGWPGITLRRDRAHRPASGAPDLQAAPGSLRRVVWP